MIDKLTDIPRIHVGQSVAVVGAEHTDDRANLAVKAKSLLGYRALMHEVSGAVDSSTDIGKLGKTLLELDVEVLHPGSVIEYQVNEAARRTKQELNRLLTANQLERVFSWGFSAAKWEYTEISKYSEAIPEFVLNKAVGIKESCPDVKFYVHHLNDPKADPFLVAVLGEEVYFVEVWEEPRFEGRMTR